MWKGMSRPRRHTWGKASRLVLAGAGQGAEARALESHRSGKRGKRSAVQGQGLLAAVRSRAACAVGFVRCLVTGCLGHLTGQF